MHRTTLVHAAVRLAKLLMVGMPAFQLWHRLRKNRQRRNSAMTSRWAFDAFALDKARKSASNFYRRLSMHGLCFPTDAESRVNTPNRLG